MSLVGEYKPCAYFQADKEKPMLELDVSRSRDIKKKDIPAYIRGFLERLSQEALLNPENVV